MTIPNTAGMQRKPKHPGEIRRLNKIRNQLAHNLEAKVTAQDKDSLLSVKTFRALREALAEPGSPSDDRAVSNSKYKIRDGLHLYG